MVSVSDAILGQNGALFGRGFADGVFVGLSDSGLGPGGDERVIAALHEVLVGKLSAMLTAGASPALAAVYEREAKAGFAQRCLEWRAAAEAGTVLLDSV